MSGGNERPYLTFLFSRLRPRSLGPNSVFYLRHPSGDGRSRTVDDSRGWGKGGEGRGGEGRRRRRKGADGLFLLRRILIVCIRPLVKGYEFVGVRHDI